MGDIGAISRGALLHLEIPYQSTSVCALLDGNQAVAKTNLGRLGCSTEMKSKESGNTAESKVQKRRGGGGRG